MVYQQNFTSRFGGGFTRVVTGRRWRVSWSRATAGWGVCLLAVCVLAGVGISTASSGMSRSGSAAGRVLPVTGADPKISVPPDGQVYLGVSTDFARLDAFSKVAGLAGMPAIYNRWTTPDGAFEPTLSQASSRPGLTPMISWNLPLQSGQVTSGGKDSYIIAQARAVRAFNHPVFVRLDWEMNAYWYSQWNLRTVTPAQFVASWRHVVALFRAAGASSALFVWAPNVLDYFSRSGERVRTAAWYPGDDVVDWAGLDAYPQSAPPSTLLNGTDGMNEMADFAKAHGKPMMLAEWAPNTPHPDTAAAVNLVFDWAESHPTTVKALVYFDFITQGRDFTLIDHPIGAETFRARTMNNPHYLTSVIS